MDNLTKKQRSYNMSQIRSKWTKQEKLVHNYLKSRKIKHRMHPNMAGHPDIVLPERKIAVFLHGCFWHKCSKHYIPPKINKKYWLPKIEKNVKRDRKNRTVLKSNGFAVITFWEHQFKSEWKSAVKMLAKTPPD